MSEDNPPYQRRIVRDPAILAGKPVVKGTRISVDLILKHLENNPGIEELFAAYPRLTAEDVKAAVAYGEMMLAHEKAWLPLAVHRTRMFDQVIQF